METLADRKGYPEPLQEVLSDTQGRSTSDKRPNEGSNQRRCHCLNKIKHQRKHNPPSALKETRPTCSLIPIVSQNCCNKNVITMS